MKIEKLLKATEDEDLPWSKDDLNRLHEQIMLRVAQTQIEKPNKTEKVRMLMRRNWRWWAQNGFMLAGLVALLLVSVDQHSSSSKKLSVLTSPGIRSSELLRGYTEEPEDFAQTVIVSQNKTDFLLEMAFY